MITLEQLDRARLARERIRESAEMLDSIRATAGLKAQELDGMPHGSGPSNRVGALAVVLADLEATIARQEQEFNIIWDECEPFVSGISDLTTRTCFRLRFQCGMNYKEIAAYIGEYTSEAAVKSRIYREIRNQRRE